MEEWKEYKLGEISDITKLAGFEFTKYVKYNPDGEIIAVRALNLRDGHLDFKDIQRIDKETSNALLRSKLYKGDIVLSYTGTIGACAIITENEKYHLAPNVCKITPYDSIEPFFLYYIIRSRDFQESLVGYAHGSTQPTIPMKTIREIPVKICSKEKQLKIASILKSLDDKIEVNRKINENLEQQAQALFKSWFVDFEPFKNGEFVESEFGMIPKGWRVVSLDEMTSKFGTGLNPRKNFKLGEGNNYYVTIKNMGNNRVYLDDKCDKVTDDAIEKINKRSKLQEGDLLFSGIGTIGRVALVTQTPTNWNTSESVFNMHPTQNISSEFLYILLLSDVFQQYVKIHAQGGVQQGIRMASLKEYRMAIPEDSLLRKFDDIVMPIISRIKNNDNQSDSLASLRDTLLPKLMSGELKVNEIA